MAAIATILTEFSDSSNSRTYVAPSHSVGMPRLVIQSRKVPAGNTSVGETSIRVIRGTVDADGVPVTAKVTFEANVRYPVNGDTDDITGALALFREIVASDNFTAAVNGQTYIV